MTVIVAAFIGAVVIVAGWFVYASQDHSAKKREVSIQYLIESYRKLEGSANRDYPHDSQYARDYEAAIADIQLFGNAKQVEMAQKMVKDYASHGRASCNELLEELRKDLRDQLKLAPVIGPRMWTRIVPKGHE